MRNPRLTGNAEFAVLAAGSAEVTRLKQTGNAAFPEDSLKVDGVKCAESLESFEVRPAGMKLPL
jgi:hypothetical protein